MILLEIYATLYDTEFKAKFDTPLQLFLFWILSFQKKKYISLKSKYFSPQCLIRFIEQLI